MLETKKIRGFTLIELMVAVSIIGILAGVMMGVVNIQGVQAKSRDSRRIADIKKIQTALELYFTDFRGYPQQTTWENVSLDTSTIYNVLSPGYIGKIPSDPLVSDLADPKVAPSGVECFNGNNNYGYYYISTSCTGVPCSAGRYVLGAIMEVETTAEGNSGTCSQLFNCSGSSPAINCNSNGNYCYCVENPL